MAPVINLLLSSFGGVGLPSTLAIPVSGDLPVTSLLDVVSSQLPSHANNLVLTTTNRRRLDSGSCASISDLSDGADFLPLRLSSVLLGGKGGFGSQLRAAGGRMSSRKNKNSGRDPNASSRNLDGRRLRTVAEAKSLAQYLATKPEMDRKEKEERRRRWESIIETAERREEEIKSGKKGARLDGEWVDRKEEEENKTREAVLAMMKADLMAVDGPTGSESEEEEDGSDDVEAEASGSSDNAEEAGGRSFFGWEEDDLSDDEEEEDDDEAEQIPAKAADSEQTAYHGKGKGRA